MNRKTLSSVVELLNVGGRNYTVFLRSYTVRLQKGASSEQLIHLALGSRAVLEHIQAVTTDDALLEVTSSISYAGDSAAGPDPTVITSARFMAHRAEFLTEIATVASMATTIEQFWLSEGHPAYPVFWDFAFLFTGSAEAQVLVGSSSD